MKNWSALSLMELVEHLEKHHLILKEKLLEVSQMMEQVVLRYADKHTDIVSAGYRNGTSLNTQITNAFVKLIFI